MGPGTLALSCMSDGWVGTTHDLTDRVAYRNSLIWLLRAKSVDVHPGSMTTYLKQLALGSDGGLAVTITSRRVWGPMVLQYTQPSIHDERMRTLVHRRTALHTSSQA